MSSRDRHNRSGMMTSPADLIASAQDVLALFVDSDSDLDEQAANSSFPNAARLASKNAGGLVFAVEAVAKRAAQTQASSATRCDGGSDRNKEWNVRAVLCGDGSFGHCGLRLEDGTIYASSSMSGRHESYWSIQAHTLRLCTQGADVLRWPAVAVTALAKRSFAGKQGPVVDIRGMSVAQMRLSVVQTLVRWVRGNRGVAVLVGGPGRRTNHPQLKIHRIKSAGKFGWKLLPGRCAEAAVIHAIWRLLGSNSGQAALKFVRDRRERYSITRLGQLRNLLHDMPVNIEARSPALPDKKAIRKNALKWLSEEARGIWIVRLTQSGVVDHCVAIDTFEALILDGAEEYPLRLCEETLRMCGGSDATELKVAEVRQIVEQERKKKKRKI